MSYNNSIPMPNDDLSDSQAQILQNFMALDTSFGQDHYTFSDLTSSNGKHKVIRTPTQGSDPSTPVDEVAFYANQPSANVGAIQFSRGPSSAVPSPVTYLHSPATAIVLGPLATINILDFTGLSRAICSFYAFASGALAGVAPVMNQSVIFWDGANFGLGTPVTGSTLIGISITSSGNILQLKNIANAARNIYWTLQMLRVS